MDFFLGDIPHPFRFGGGWGLFDPSSMPFEKGISFSLIGNCYCTFADLCSTDFLKETAPVEGNWIIALFKSLITSHLLPTWEDGA